jgi:hypothetical protein
MQDLKNKIENLYLKYRHKNKPVDICSSLKDKYEKWYKYTRKNGDSNPKNSFWLEYNKTKPEYFEIKKELENLYFNEEYGFKSLGKLLNISYTIMRQLFEYFEIDSRKGTSVVTNRVKKFRKDKAFDEMKNNKGMYNNKLIRKSQKTNRGVQGYYFNKWFDKKVWLRSTYEFIYAQWLDNKNIKWDVEVESYRLSDNTQYRPDFFIYENDIIKKIVEIKGFWDIRAYKASLLKKEYGIDIILLDFSNQSIEDYIIDNKKYSQKLKEWKQIIKFNNKMK